MVRSRGFTFLELLLAVVIVATALVALSASVTSGIASAGDSINQRAAREACRSRIEAIAAGADVADGAPIEGFDAFTVNVQREERSAGAADTPEEKYVVVTVTVNYPSDREPPPSATGTPGFSSQPKGTASVSFSTIILPQDVRERQKQLLAQGKTQ